MMRAADECQAAADRAERRRSGRDDEAGEECRREEESEARVRVRAAPAMLLRLSPCSFPAAYGLDRVGACGNCVTLCDTVHRTVRVPVCVPCVAR